MRRFAVPRREGVGEVLRADAVDARHKVRVGDGGIARLDGPHRLAEGADGGGGVEHDLGAVHAEGLPVHGVVPPVADVDGDLAKHGLKHRVPGVALHVVGGLVEVAHARNVVLAVLADDIAVVADDDCGVPDGVSVRGIPLQDGADDDHVVLARDGLAHAGGGPRLGALRKLQPLLLARAERKGHGPRLLEAEHVHAFLACVLHDGPHLLKYRQALVRIRLRGGQWHAVLDYAHPRDARRGELHRRRGESERLHLKVAPLRLRRVRGRHHPTGVEAVQVPAHRLQLLGW
mmetsp:Transcript_20915/g.53601  ORF Transcript_20915/g.53601 Transcript_20915/m.53601 type:complete len:289 (+) Transcript_20915:761-1627(+)